MIDDSKMSLHSLMGNIGYGSNRQDFVGELQNISMGSSETSGSKV